MSNPTELLELIKNHPELPVVPMVGAEIVADDTYAYWIGSWGHVEITRYLTGDEHVHFYDETDEEEICQTLNDWPSYREDAYERPGTENLDIYKALPWIEAIIVYIETPD